MIDAIFYVLQCGKGLSVGRVSQISVSIISLENITIKTCLKVILETVFSGNWTKLIYIFSTLSDDYPAHCIVDIESIDRKQKQNIDEKRF